MTVSLKHLVTATGTDAGNGQIGKAQWNDEHALTLASQKLLGRASAGTGSVEEIDLTAAGRALLDDPDATAQRATLGLGSMAEQNANSVAITGGSIANSTITTLQLLAERLLAFHLSLSLAVAQEALTPRQPELIWG